MANWSPLTDEPTDTSHLTFDERMSLFNKNIKSHNNIVFFGGAGVSTASGIPDFRSKDGLYNQHDVKFDGYEPEYLLSRECLYHNPTIFYEFYRQKLDCRRTQPNITHFKLAEMEAAGKLDCVVTQNIDGLHQKAGSRKVLELHGSVLRNHCTRCGQFYGVERIVNSRGVPRCSCGGIIKPDVVLYEESLPEQTVEQAVRAIAAADVLLIGGTSLTVYPACNLLRYFNGEHLVVLNRDATQIDEQADLCIRDKIGTVLSQIVLP